MVGKLYPANCLMGWEANSVCVTADLGRLARACAPLSSLNAKWVTLIRGRASKGFGQTAKHILDFYEHYIAAYDHTKPLTLLYIFLLAG
jgi:hypothetical protein